MSGVATTIRRIALYDFEIAWLFTRSDFKTVMFPVMIFAIVLSPTYNLLTLSLSLCWLWFHLLQSDLANQTYSVPEDTVNKPWRPLPSGLITVKNCRALRWGVVIFCLGLSSFFSFNVVITSALFSVLVIAYNDFRLSNYAIFKNLCNAGGYASFELGTTLILSGESSLDWTSIKALSWSALVILMTIHEQDFADIGGDRILGRRTLPIVAPKGSRIYTLCVIPLLSLALAFSWSLGPFCSILFVSLGFGVGFRCFFFRDEVHDQSTFLLYNMWLMGAHLLPANARFHVLAW